MTTDRKLVLAALAGFALLTALATALVNGSAWAATGGAGSRPLVPVASTPGDPSASPGDPSASPDTTPTAAPICRVTYELTIENGGLKATVTITNQSLSTINGWYLGFTLPAGQTITRAVGATYDSPSGAVTAFDVGTNAVVPPRASVVIELWLSYDGTLAKPPAFTVNGHTCAVG